MDFYRWIRAQWDRSAAVVALVIGILALFFGWLGTSGKALPTEQIPYLISGGMFGIIAIGIAGTLWLSADLRDEWRKLDAIHRSITNLHGSDEPTGSRAAHAADEHAEGGYGQGGYSEGSYGDDSGQYTIELPRVSEHDGGQALPVGYPEPR